MPLSQIKEKKPVILEGIGNCIRKIHSISILCVPKDLNLPGQWPPKDFALAGQVSNSPVRGNSDIQQTRVGRRAV